ncbi:THO complex subunit 5 homolog isoform X2 [Bolinopsis microptera]|uniref:THO complex subunit 5 homolog isoform X2 n=1 Tax=Bolinopsis microptera TaxID=2820187 RepID=UPI00307A3CD1
MVDACLQYKKTCSLLHESLNKLQGLDEPSQEVVENCMQYFAQLKKFNCKAQQQCRRVRDNTRQLKKKLDSTDLILKNLQFEEIYLQREITKCLQYKSVDEELSLIQESEYLISLGDEKPPPDQHEHMLQRLKWELEQRKAMRVDQERWEKSKVSLEEEIAGLKGYLASLPPQLEEMLATTAQVQDYLGMKLVHKKTQAEMAAWLPPQLYNIYSQVTGYTEYLKLGTTVTINGDLEIAKNLSTDDASDVDEVVEIETKHSKRRSAVNDPGKKKVFKAHPLTVEVIVPCDDGVHAKVLFSYLTKLKVVTVSISLMITTASPWRDKFSVGTDYMSSKELLCALWSEDYGDECPNPDTPSILNKNSLPSKTKIPNSLGRPFLWAQRLAGITGWSSDAKLDVATSRETVPHFLEAIKQRCLARLALKYQLRSRSRTPPPPPPEVFFGGGQKEGTEG